MRTKLARHALSRECYPTALGFYPRAAGHSMARQRHDDNLMIYCVEGLGHARAGEWAGTVGPGQVLLLPQGLAHEYHADDVEPWSIYWVHYQGSGTAVFNQYLGHREGQVPVHGAGLSPALVGQFRGLLAAGRTGYNTRVFINTANQLRHLFTQAALDIRGARAGGPNSFDLEAVQALMRENLHQPLDLDTLAGAANLSKYHFATKYKSLTGYSPIKHFLNMKMEQACQLLDSSELSVKGVAAALGYDDPLYFSRQFSRTVGLSPRDYRRSVRS